MAVRIGILGAGGMGSNHAGTFKSMPGVALAACYDLDPERAEKCRKDHGVERAVSSIDELIDRCDAVVIATPDALHAPQTLAVLNAGKHVLCEKPLTCTLTEAREVAVAAKAASAKGQIHMIDFSYRRSAAAQEAMRLARSGALGRIRHVHSMYLQSWIPCRPVWGNEDWRASSLLWKLSTSEGSGGVLNDLGCHLLDLTTACSEDLTAIRCDLRCFPKPLGGSLVDSYGGKALDANDTALIEMQFESGGVGIAHTTRWATGYTNAIQVEVHGEEGAVRFDLDRSYEVLDFCLGDARHRAEWQSQKLPPAPTVPERFVNAIRSGRRDEPDLFRGAQIQAYLEAAFQSGRSGKWEPIPAWLTT